MDLKKILMKYAGEETENINFLNELLDEDPSLGQLTERSDLESEPHSPRLPDEDDALQRLKNKYLGRNSPDLKKEDSLRQSSEHLFTESLN